MPDSVNLTEPVNHLKWQQAFLAVGTRRSWPLLAGAGVPERMTGAPEFLLISAQRFVVGQNWLGVLMPSPAIRAYDHAGKQLIWWTFGELGRVYGEEARNTLYAWTQRFFVQHDQMCTWLEWSWLLPHLAGVYGRGLPLTPSPFGEAAQRRLVDTIARRFGPGPDQRLKELEAEAEGIPLSPLEESLLALEPEDEEDDPSWDVCTLLPIRKYRAFEVIGELGEWMDEREQALFMQWARQEASAEKRPFDHLRMTDEIDVPGSRGRV